MLKQAMKSALALLSLSVLALQTSACNTYFLHLQLKLQSAAALTGSFTPCVGLTDQSGKILQTVLCDSGATFGAGQLTQNSIDTTWQFKGNDLPAGDVSADFVRPFLLAGQQLYAPAHYDFVSPDQTSDGDYLLKATFDLSDAYVIPNADYRLQ